MERNPIDMRIPHKFLIPWFGKNKDWATLTHWKTFNETEFNFKRNAQLTDLMYKAFLCNVGDCLVISS